MIPDEIGNEIDAKCDMQESKNNSRNKEMQEYENQKGEAPAIREAYSLNEHPHNRNKRPISGRANSGSSESDLVSVCVKGKLVHINNVHKVITRQLQIYETK